MTTPHPAVIALTVLVQAGTALAAGAALLRPFDRADPRAGRVAARSGAAIAGPALLVLPSAGALPVAVGLVLAAAVLALPATLARPRLALVAGSTVAGAVGGGLIPAGDPVHVALGMTQELAAALWLGALLRSSAPGARYAKRLSVAGAAVLTLTWCGELVLDRALLTRGTGVLAALVVAASVLTVAGLALRASARSGRPAATWLPAAGVAGLVALTALVDISAGRAAPAPGTGVPVLASVRVAGRPVPVLVVPGRPGWNLVHLGPGATSFGADPAHAVTGTIRPGTGHIWAEVRLPAGRSRWWVGDGAQGGWLTLDAGTGRPGADLRGADGPECASQALGRLLTGSAAPVLFCPADRLDPADADALRAAVRFVATRGATAVGLVADSSPRSTTAAAVVRDEAAHLRVRIAPAPDGNPLLVVAGWAAAYRVLTDVASGRVRAQGAYLAPWLLNGPLLSEPAGQLIPLRFDPRGPATLEYLAALGAHFPGEPPSSAGYTGWRGSRPETAPVRLYAASRVFVPGDPASGAHDHHTAGGAANWLPHGTVIPVSEPWPAA